MDTNDTIIIAAEPNTNQKGNGKKILNKAWQVFKGLFIAACILALMFDTFVAIMYYINDMNVTEVSISVPYPYTTQDYADIEEEYSKNPEGTKWREMRRNFYAKYSIKYKDSATYAELEYMRKQNKTDSEEYKQKLDDLMYDFGITAEEITFDE